MVTPREMLRELADHQTVVAGPNRVPPELCEMVLSDLDELERLRRENSELREERGMRVREVVRRHAREIEPEPVSLGQHLDSLTSIAELLQRLNRYARVAQLLEGSRLPVTRYSNQALALIEEGRLRAHREHGSEPLAPFSSDDRKGGSLEARRAALGASRGRLEDAAERRIKLNGERILDCEFWEFMAATTPEEAYLEAVDVAVSAMRIIENGVREGFYDDIERSSEQGEGEEVREVGPEKVRKPLPVLEEDGSPTGSGG